MVCGHALLDVGRIDDAERELSEAYAIRRALHLDFQLLQNELSRAEVALARGNGKEARDIAANVAQRYHEKGLQPDEMAAHELMARAALAYGDDELAAQDFAPLLSLARGEHAEFNLQIDLLAARLALRTAPSEANRKAVEALLQKASEVGYERIAQATRKAMATDTPQ